jgi:hypothetical protein
LEHNSEATDAQNILRKNSGRDLSILLWNVEGLKSVLNLSPDNLLTSQDTLILTETFITEHIDLPGYYAAHSYAVQKQEGRP